MERENGKNFKEGVGVGVNVWWGKSRKEKREKRKREIKGEGGYMYGGEGKRRPKNRVRK